MNEEANSPIIWPCILVRGNDDVLIAESIDKIENLLSESSSVSRHDADEDASIESIRHFLYSNSLTGERRMVVLRINGFFSKKKSDFVFKKWHEEVREFLNYSDWKNLLVIVTDELDNIDSELHRIILKKGIEKKIDNGIKPVIRDDRFFELSDAILGKNSSRVLSIIETMSASEVFSAMTIIGWSMRIFSDFLELQRKGAGEVTITKNLGLRSFQYKKYNKIAHLWSVNSVMIALLQLAELDLELKTRGVDNINCFVSTLYGICKTK